MFEVEILSRRFSCTEMASNKRVSASRCVIVCVSILVPSCQPVIFIIATAERSVISGKCSSHGFELPLFNEW